MPSARDQVATLFSPRQRPVGGGPVKLRVLFIRLSDRRGQRVSSTCRSPSTGRRTEMESLPGLATLSAAAIRHFSQGWKDDGTWDDVLHLAARFMETEAVSP